MGMTNDDRSTRDEPETAFQAAARLLLLAEHVRSRIQPIGGVLGVSGLRTDIRAMRLILDRLEKLT